MNPQKTIGFDIDGVLANFSTSYMRLIILMTGKNLFAEGDWTHPPSWDWDLDRGYTKDERRAAFLAIGNNEGPTKDFWANLGSLVRPEDTGSVILWNSLCTSHNVYFATQRVGPSSREQTERWLQQNLGLWAKPTVLITAPGVKGYVAKALALDAYLDDNWDNGLHCLQESPKTNTFLFDTSYNRLYDATLDHAASLLPEQSEPLVANAKRLQAHRVVSIREFLGRIGLDAYTEMYSPSLEVT